MMIVSAGMSAVAIVPRMLEPGSYPIVTRSSTTNKRGEGFHVLVSLAIILVTSCISRRNMASLTGAAVIPEPSHEVWKFGNERIFDYICILVGCRTNDARQEGSDGDY